jgi:acyl carrier protein
MSNQIRTLIAETRVLSVPIETLSDTDDLFDAGLSSLGSAELVMALEEALGVMFPDEMLTRETIHTIASLRKAIAKLQRMSAVHA